MLLTLDKISKNFKIAGERVPVLESLDFSIDRGEIISITGRSGCGKTTLLNIMTGITPPDRGSIFFEGSRVYHQFDFIMSRLRNRRIGQIFQTFRLLDDETVLNNILLPARISGNAGRDVKMRALEMLERTGLGGFEKTRAGLLSGGQKQRAAIARALVKNPDLILADEPTANLDAETSTEIFTLLEELKNEGRALLIVTHKGEMHHKSDRVYRMENGGLTLIETGGKPLKGESPEGRGASAKPAKTVSRVKKVKVPE